jgi:hypothetical protein
MRSAQTVPLGAELRPPQPKSQKIADPGNFSPAPDITVYERAVKTC